VASGAAPVSGGVRAGSEASVYGMIVIVALAAIAAVIVTAAGGPLVIAVLPLAIGAGAVGAFQVYKRREVGQRTAELRAKPGSDTTDFTARDRETQA
jgi:hypothetical protein